MNFFIAFLMTLLTAFQASATIYPSGDLTAVGSCTFNFEYGVCSKGIECRKFGVSWTREVEVSARITDWSNNDTQIQYLEVQPFKTDLEFHFTAKDYPDTSFPYAGLHQTLKIGLRSPDKYSGYFERDGSLWRAYYVKILRGQIILARVGHARLGLYDKVRRDFQCDLKIAE